MNGYFPTDTLKDGASQVVGASKTNLVISKEFKVTASGSKHLRIDVIVDTVTVAAGITIKLQTTSGMDHAGNAKWVDFGAPKTVSVTAAGVVSLLANNDLAADAAYLPLANKGRVTVTTGIGDAVTIEGIRVLQEE